MSFSRVFRATQAGPLRLGLGVALPLGVALALVPALSAQTSNSSLPDAPGKQTVTEVCGKCHSPDRAAALHQSRRAWQATVAQMVSMGAAGSDDQFNAIVDYLSKNFPAIPPTPVNVNTADAVELESSLLLLKSEARTLMQYRKEHGPFKSIDDLRNVPGLDFKKVEDSKVRIVF
jgi:competence protein ComEA